MGESINFVLLYGNQLWKQSLSSDGQQFNQCQQNEQLPSHQTIENKTTTTYGGGNSITSRHTCVAFYPRQGGVNLHLLISNGNTEKNKQWKPCTGCFHKKLPQTITKWNMNNTNMDSTITGSVRVFIVKWLLAMKGEVVG